jgi:hypothetical protein
MNLHHCENLKPPLRNFLHLPFMSFSLGILVSYYEDVNMNYEIQVNLVHKTFADMCMGYKYSCYKTLMYQPKLNGKVAPVPKYYTMEVIPGLVPT